MGRTWRPLYDVTNGRCVRVVVCTAEDVGRLTAVELLLACGAHDSARNSNGDDALSAAVANGASEEGEQQ
jgi:hypothetical protein